MPPDIKAEEIVSATVAANGVESPGNPMVVAPLPEVADDTDPDAGANPLPEPASGQPSLAVEVVEKPLPQLPPPDCSTVMCAQVKVSENCIEPKFETPPGECCAQLVCAGGYSTSTVQDCRPELCPQVMPASNCIDPVIVFTSDTCCGTLECAGGYSTPSCKTVGCPEGKQCVEMCAGCIPGPNGCPPNPCKSECYDVHQTSPTL